MGIDLFNAALECLVSPDVDSKVAGVLALDGELQSGRLDRQVLQSPIPQAGFPPRPLRVAPVELPARGFHSSADRMALVHAIAHIEFNAINLALDAVCRFPGMPDAYYLEWLEISIEEARHFQLLRDLLRSRRMDYGDLPAHGGLWDMAMATSGDVLDRMAVVPRVLEARGLDVTPSMIERFQQCDETEIAAILQRIYIDEIGHVKIGNYWYHWICSQRQIDAEQAWKRALDDYGIRRGGRQLNREARRKAGFSDSEIKTVAGLE